ncbi:MAG: hypothetical protein RDV48_21270 [Candidatus Eremiobacteraeota bacterium]|nr:hypothetical protein [Candidatus Eremiobacteraeota bacterium]
MKRLFSFIILFMMLLAAAGCGGGSSGGGGGAVSYGGSTVSLTPDPATTPVQVSGLQPPIAVIMNLHMDPVGTMGATEARLKEYATHRQAFLWLKEQAGRQKFKISAECTGLYAEFAVKNGHEADFSEFMPGRYHILGTHTHSHYKGDADTGQDYHWTEDPGHSAATADKIFTDQIGMVNQIFTRQGFKETDNALFHGSQSHSADMASSMGTPPNSNSYPNFFTTIEGQRRLYHPYRSGAETDVIQGKEDLSQPFIAVPTSSALFGYNEVHGAEGMLQGTLPYVQRDFVLEFLEWRYYQNHGLPARPWVFGIDEHPYQIMSQCIGSDGKPVQETLPLFYEWLNTNFIGSASQYATITDVSNAYKTWEQLHPGELLYPPAGTGKIVADLKIIELYRRLFAGEKSCFLVRHYDTDSVRVFEFANDQGARHAVYYTDDPARISSTLDLSSSLSGAYHLISLSGSSGEASLSSLPVTQDPQLLSPR